MATLDKVIDFSKLSEYDTKIKIHINEVKGDKNNVAFTHGYTQDSVEAGEDGGVIGDVSNRYFSFRDVRTEDDALTISETENSVSVRFQNTLGGGISGPAETRELPTKAYLDNAVSLKQDTLVSGSNIKTINGASVLGEGDLEIKVSESLETDFTPFDSTPESYITQSGDFYGQFKFYKNNGFSSDKHGIEFKETDIGYDIKTSLGMVKDSFNGNIVAVGEYTTSLVSKEYVDNAISAAGGASLSINTLSNPGGDEIKSTITQGDNSTEISYQKNMNDELPNYINARVNDDRFSIPTTDYVDEVKRYVDSKIHIGYDIDGNSNPTYGSFTLFGYEGGKSEFISFHDIGSPNGFSITGEAVYGEGHIDIGPFYVPSKQYVDDKIKIIEASTVGSKSDSTGVFIPATINPSSIGNGSLLVTEASGTTLGSKSLSVTTGTGQSITSVSATNAPTTTSFTFAANSWSNKLKAIIYSNKGVATRSESTANETVNIVSVTNDGKAITTASKPTDFVENKTIVVNTDAPIPGEGAISNIRIYPKQEGFSNLLCGQGIASNGGASVVVGQVCYSQGNANLVVGATMVNTGNGSTLLGREHFNNKNRVFLAGTGHDTTNGPAECVAAVGQWSSISAKTAFAVGNGTSNTARSNAFEVTADGKLILKSPNGTRWAISVTDTGEITTAQV